MNRFRRIVANLSCQLRECIHNSDGVCDSKDEPRILLFRDRSFRCESKEEKTYQLKLTDEEIRCIGDILSRQPIGISVINRILRKIEQHIYPEFFVR